MEHSANPTPKCLVVLYDGTGNEISENISNVLKLDRSLHETGICRTRRVDIC